MTRLLIAGLLLFGVCHDLKAQHRNRQENRSLLGVVTAPVQGGVEVLHVLEESPAARAGIQVGDVLRQINRTKLEDITDVDDALREVSPEATVEVELRRHRKSVDLEVPVIARSKYAGEFLERPRRRVGFEAPRWFAYAWANASRKTPAPTQKNTDGKVVVIHAFQSW